MIGTEGLIYNHGNMKPRPEVEDARIKITPENNRGQA